MKTIGFSVEAAANLRPEDIKYFMKVKKSKGRTFLDPYKVESYEGESVWRVLHMVTAVSWIGTTHALPDLKAYPLDVEFFGEKEGFRLKGKPKSAEFILCDKAYPLLELDKDGTSTKPVGTFKYEGDIIIA